MHKKHNYKIIPSAQSTHSAADVSQVFKSSCKFKFIELIELHESVPVGIVVRFQCRTAYVYMTA